jgi:single-strand DNA-binding protein
MANLNYNKVILGGRLTADPELRMTQNGTPVANFTIASSERYGQEQKTLFQTCVAWNKTAQLINDYFRKGSSILVDGKLQQREWTDQQGQKRRSTEVVVLEVHFVDSKSESKATAEQPAVGPIATIPQSSVYDPPVGAPVFNDVTYDDDLPF